MSETNLSIVEAAGPLNEFGQPARPEDARASGVPLTGFTEWAEEHLR